MARNQTKREQVRVPDSVLKHRPELSAFAKFQAAHPDMECVQVEVDAVKNSPMSPRAIQAIGYRHPDGHSASAPMMDEDNNVYCFMMKPKAVIQAEQEARDPRLIERRKSTGLSTVDKLRRGNVGVAPSINLAQMGALLGDGGEEPDYGPLDPKLESALEKGGAYEQTDE